MTEFLPRASAPAVDSSGRFTRETYDALRRTIAALNDADIALSERQRETLAILNALGADDVESLEALGPLLDGKQDASEVLGAVSAIIGTGIVTYKPGAVIGRTIAPVAGETTVSNGSGLAGNPTVGLADVANSGAGSLLAITRDAKGRVSGTKAATITGTAGRVTVANGDAVAGLPTVDLATVADGGGGTLLRIVRDAWGRITGTSAATTSDLAEGSNLYHTAQRVRDTILTGLSTATNAVITVTDTVLSALGKLQAQISGLIVQTITDGDTTHAPSGDAVFDALAGKVAKAGDAMTGTLTSSANLGSGGAWLGPALFPEAGAGGVFAQRDAATARFMAYSAGAPSQFLGARVGGTIAAPTATPTTVGLFDLYGVSHDGTDFRYPALITFITTQAHSSTARGVQQVFYTTPTGGTALTVRMRIDADGLGSVQPGADNTQNLGVASARWKEVFAGNATINTSDAREKRVRGPLTVAERAAALEIKAAIVMYQWNDAIAEKGKDARLHCSPTVQSVIAIMEKHGLDPFRYGFVCYDEWDETPEAKDPETGEVTQEYRPAGDRYSLRPTELLFFIMAAL